MLSALITRENGWDQERVAELRDELDGAVNLRQLLQNAIEQGRNDLENSSSSEADTKTKQQIRTLRELIALREVVKSELLSGMTAILPKRT
jgi:hypothetical protein